MYLNKNKLNDKTLGNKHVLSLQNKNPLASAQTFCSRPLYLDVVTPSSLLLASLGLSLLLCPVPHPNPPVLLPYQVSMPPSLRPVQSVSRGREGFDVGLRHYEPEAQRNAELSNGDFTWLKWSSYSACSDCSSHIHHKIQPFSITIRKHQITNTCTLDKISNAMAHSIPITEPNCVTCSTY